MATKPRSLGDILQEFSQHQQVMRSELQKVIVGQDRALIQRTFMSGGPGTFFCITGLTGTLMLVIARDDISFITIEDER